MEKRPDDFHSPKPRKAAGKTVVETVLAATVGAGMSLLSLLSGLLAAALILYSGYVLYDSFATQERAKSGWDLLQYKPSIVSNQDQEQPEDVQSLLAEINPDYRAWLTVYDTNIDYPVMQGSDDLYYAYHDIYKESSLTGAIYLAAGNSPDLSDNYNLIYGHHMDNKAMFGGLDLYREESYFESHREGILVAPSGVYDLYAFAVVETDAYQNRIYSVGNRMDDVLAFLRGNVTGADEAGPDWSRDTEAIIFDEVPLEGVTKIVALSTCASANTNGRLLVYYVARPHAIEDIPATTEPTPTPDPNATPKPDEWVPTKETEQEPFLSSLFSFFHPRGIGRAVWALVNLICLIITIYLFIPLLHLCAKFDRPRKMRKINENKRQLRTIAKIDEAEIPDRTRLEELVQEARQKLAESGLEAAVGDATEAEYDDAVETLFYRVKRFQRRFRIGLVLELIVALLALIAFILTEDMRLPMVLIDRWTPLMIVLLLIEWLLDVRLIRYRDKVLADEEEAERQRQEQAAPEQ